MVYVEWTVKLMEKGRITLPKELRERLDLRKGEVIKLILEKRSIRLVIPRLEEDVIDETKGVIKGVEPELSPEELEETFLAAFSFRVKAGEERS